MSRIPYTITRLSQSLGIVSSHQVDQGVVPTSLDPAKLAEYAASSRVIGAAYGFRIMQVRENIRRHGIDAPIEPFAIAPGRVTTTLEVQFMVLHTQDAMQAFDFSSGNVANQMYPLLIQEVISPPSIPIGSVMPGAVGDFLNSIKKAPDLSQVPIGHTFAGCWISNSTMNYSLKDADQAVTQQLTLDVARVVNVSLRETALQMGVRQIAKNISLIPAGVTSTATNLLRRTGLF